MITHLTTFLDKFLIERKISTYLEIGTREGDSLKIVIKHNPKLQHIVLSDIWGSAYGGSGRGNHNHISELLTAIGFDSKKAEFLDGDSKKTILTIKEKYRNFFDLILVDGDHSYEGGMADLENVFDLCKNNGIIIFDDINHFTHKYLDKCFDEFVTKYSHQILKTEKLYDGHGVGVIFKT